jgi:hypothetical protein
MDRRMKVAVSSLLVLWSLTLGAAQSSANPKAQRSQLRERRLAPGRLIAEGHNTKPVGRLKLLTYKLEEVDLLQPAELETRGAKEQISTAFRLTVTSEAVQGSRVIWIDDVLLPEVWEAGLKSVATLIYDRSIIRDGAVISVGIGSELHDLPERLRLPQSFMANQEPEKIEEGNKIVSIRSALKIARSARERVVMIEMRTARPLPVINSSYLVQIGRRFFGRVGGHGTNWVLELTVKEFAELKEGERMAIGIGVLNVAYLGRLDKGLIDR